MPHTPTHSPSLDRPAVTAHTPTGTEFRFASFSSRFCCLRSSCSFRRSISSSIYDCFRTIFASFCAYFAWPSSPCFFSAFFFAFAASAFTSPSFS